MKNNKKKLVIMFIILLLVIIALLLFFNTEKKQVSEVEKQDTVIEDKTKPVEGNSTNIVQEDEQTKNQEVAEEINELEIEEKKEEQKPIQTEAKQDDKKSKPKGHYETIEEIIPAYDEEVLVRAAWDEKIS